MATRYINNTTNQLFRVLINARPYSSFLVRKTDIGHNHYYLESPA